MKTTTSERRLGVALVFAFASMVNAQSPTPPAQKETPPAPGTPKNFKLPPTRTFSPLLPLHKYPPLRAGQSWRESNIDVVSETLSGAIRQVAPRPAGDGLPDPDRRPPAEVLARVRDHAEELITPRGQHRTCWVIEHGVDDGAAKTWVDVADGKVMRHEASVLGETFALVRD